MTTPNSIPDLKHNYYDIKTYEETANFLRSKLPSELSRPKVAIVCGSGLGGLASTLTEPLISFDYRVCIVIYGLLGSVLPLWSYHIVH